MNAQLASRGRTELTAMSGLAVQVGYFRLINVYKKKKEEWILKVFVIIQFNKRFVLIRLYTLCHLTVTCFEIATKSRTHLFFLFTWIPPPFPCHLGVFLKLRTKYKEGDRVVLLDEGQPFIHFLKLFFGVMLTFSFENIG